LVLIPSLLKNDQEWRRLAVALNHLQPRLSRATVNSLQSELEREWRYWLTAIPEQSISPGEALFGHISYAV
jgi:hypothetical protein